LTFGHPKNNKIAAQPTHKQKAQRKKARWVSKPARPFKFSLPSSHDRKGPRRLIEKQGPLLLASYLLGLLAKIKCSICSNQLNL